MKIEEYLLMRSVEMHNGNGWRILTEDTMFKFEDIDVIIPRRYRYKIDGDLLLIGNLRPHGSYSINKISL